MSHWLDCVKAQTTDDGSPEIFGIYLSRCLNYEAYEFHRGGVLMKTKSLLLMCVAVGCGLISMLGVKQFMSNNQSQEAETVEVLVATQSIGSGDPLDESNTEFVAYPLDTLAEGVVTDREQVVERSLLSNVYPGDFILVQKLSNKGDIGITGQIPRGMRAVTLKVDATTSHSGMMKPGHRVDVMCTYKVRSRTGMKSETKTVLQYIEVLATDNTSDAGSADAQQSSSKNVTLLVTPEEATKFLQAKDFSNNNLHLALRANSDTEDIDSSELNDSWLTGGDDEEPAPTKVATQPTVPTDVAGQLRQEFDGSQQLAMIEETPAPSGSWDIEIFEGETRRVESVSLPGEEPVTQKSTMQFETGPEPEPEPAAADLEEVPALPLDTGFEADSFESEEETNEVEEADELVAEPARR